MKRTSILISFLLLFNFVSGNAPHISFFCELPGDEFNELFSDTTLIKDLVEMNISLRIGLHDFSPERATTIQKLNKAGIPVVAWLLLPEEDGYWFNMHNGGKAEKRYDDFKKWTEEYQLNWKVTSVVATVDLKRYQGKWYEIARLPNFFERKLKCATATYTLRDDGKITVLNGGNYITDPQKSTSSTGVAWVPDKNSPAKLKVQFFWPFTGDY